MKKYIPNIRLFLLTIVAANMSQGVEASTPEIDLDYYASINGLSGASLKQAVYELITPGSSASNPNGYTTLAYGSGNKHTWWGFYVTDRLANNEVIDRYSRKVRYFGERGDAVSGMNIEHSYAKSWWGGSTSTNAYRDLYNLMPCDESINNTKSNYVMGKVTSGDTGNNFTKVGYSAYNFKVWEPADEWKGDFARGYMYMCTAYQNLSWSGAGTNFLDNNTYPTLKSWASNLYLQWARADLPTEEEVQRNQTVSDIQGNRNPFVDFPNLMEYLWGDSTDVRINLLTTKKSAPFTGGAVDPSDTYQTLYEANYLSNNAGSCTTENVVLPSGFSAIWRTSADYGWTASAYKGAQYASEALLFTPEIDMSAYASGRLSFEHAVNKGTSTPQERLSVIARTEDGVDISLEVNNWPTGKNWTFVSSGNVSLAKLAGKKFRVGFRYTSTTSDAPTWEIRRAKVEAIGKYNGVDAPMENIPSQENDVFMEVEYYSLEGIRVNPDTFRGIAIRRQGNSVTKVILR